ncbi:hypothetical protein B0H15DRAFT_855580 [Mycena belliarum]|uniref:F-box domain-containing protein n=1 Tax=Mycena belliarum TaxID=1033014 RepID=A0AAD6XM76_9AGAR|nr:hypothetical protein B0H15DRAFT_855580 [Mycena belliae]
MESPCPRCGCSPAPEADPADRGQLRLRLAQLNSLIASLSAEHERLLAQSDSIVYPVLSLPPEVVSLIFIRCIPSGSPVYPSPIEAPLLLTQICRQWREIAIDTPELWQSIALLDTRSVEVFNSWILRSGSLPLTFSLNCVDPIHAASLLDVCLPHVRRWQDVELALPAGVLRRLDDDFPLLMLRNISLLLRGPFSQDGNLTTTQPITMSNAPLLCSANVATYPDVALELPWTQLTSLTLGRLDPGDCFAILQRCPLLTTLDISITGAATEAESLPLLTLPLLESFTFPSDLSTALPRLRFPRLAHIHIRETVVFGAAHAGALQTLLTHVPAPVARLALTLKYPASPTLEHCLAAVPASLPTLALHCGNAATIAPLLAVLQRPGVLPALARLRIAGGRVFDGDYAEIAAMLRARLGTLHEFVLVVETYGRAEAARDVPRIRAMPRFRALAADGLRMRIEQPVYPVLTALDQGVGT